MNMSSTTVATTAQKIVRSRGMSVMALVGASWMPVVALARIAV